MNKIVILTCRCHRNQVYKVRVNKNSNVSVIKYLGGGGLERDIMKEDEPLGKLNGYAIKEITDIQSLLHVLTR